MEVADFFLLNQKLYRIGKFGVNHLILFME